MATTRLSDAFIPSIYASYQTNDNPELSVLVRAGIVVNSPMLNTIARTGGMLSTIPFWNDLDPDSEPNYSNDDPADLAVPEKINSGSMVARKAFLNKGYSDMDLVQELAGSSPMQHIRSRFDTYWRRQLERRVIATAVGVMNNNQTDDAGDMIVDISGNAGDAAKFGSDAFIDAAYTSGDYADNYRAIAVHSSIEARMVKNDEIVMMPDSAGRLTIPTYKGRVVVTTDNMPILSGTGTDTVFLSILFGAGALGFGTENGSSFAIGEGIPRVPAEVERNPREGSGGGSETLWERKTWMLHPGGFTWKELSGGDAITEFSPTLANLREGKRWERVVARKHVGMAFIKSKA